MKGWSGMYEVYGQSNTTGLEDRSQTQSKAEEQVSGHQGAGAQEEDEEKYLILHLLSCERMKPCVLVPKAFLPNKNWACTHNSIRTRTKRKCPDQVHLLSSSPNFWIAEKKAIPKVVSLHKFNLIRPNLQYYF